jgi:tetrahydromethanopterin S-methyltransferase subunit H
MSRHHHPLYLLKDATTNTLLANMHVVANTEQQAMDFIEWLVPLHQVPIIVEVTRCYCYLGSGGQHHHLRQEHARVLHSPPPRLEH